MDLLLLPQDPTFPTPDTPYLSTDNWDLAPFGSYLERTYHDLGLTEVPELPHDRVLLSLSLFRLLSEVDAAKLRACVQTWLFFGLIAEFLALNETDDGVRYVPLEQAEAEMAELYRELSTTSADGNRFLSSASIVHKTELFRQRLVLEPNRSVRYTYLHSCLSRTVLLLENTAGTLGHCVRYSIACVGELFTTSLYTGSYLARPPIELPINGFNWFRDYLKVGGEVETQMIAQGWCPSEVEKIRHVFQGISSLHYVSRMRPRTTPEDHMRCSGYACRAFQIDITTYKPRHAVDGCECAEVCVDESALSQILKTSPSYPVLKINVTRIDGNDSVEVTMEPYTEGVKYVALSHVWADGLGNPRQNALPGCQLAKVARSVAQLARDHAVSGESGVAEAEEYRVWIDTICCPIELGGKAIALERIAKVYENAAHVLVFDSSLMCLDTTECHLVYLILRVFSCSPWMRRLWTLQEAILAKDLCVQFKDRTASTATMMQELYVAGMQDMRLLKIRNDLLNEVGLLQSFRESTMALGDMYQTMQLSVLQRALHFRTVSVPSDEPLCIATLMDLRIGGLTLMTDGEERMARVWTALADLQGGALSSSLVFYLEETLSKKGWRWAPKSLLGSLGADSSLGLDARMLRFAVKKPVTPYSVAVPTPKGLRMTAPGMRITVKPLRPHLDLLPWRGVAKKLIEPYVLLKRESTGGWYRVADWFRSQKLAIWTEEERKAYDEKHPAPLFDCMKQNNSALIFENFSEQAEATFAILGAAEPDEVDNCNDDDDDNGKDDNIVGNNGEDENPAQGSATAMTATLFRRERSVLFVKLPDRDARLVEKVIAIGNRLADDQVTADLHACGPESSPERDECVAKVKAWLIKTVDEEWKSDPEFARLALQVLGSDMEGSTWPVILTDCSNFITMKDTDPQQVWIVD